MTRPKRARRARGARTLKQELQQLRDAVQQLRKHLDAAIVAPQRPSEVGELADLAAVIAANFSALRERVARQICAAGYPLDAKEHPPDTIPCAHYPGGP